ncbi:hypothetical protein [Streptomyces sp. NPDC001621]|uniref:hypothetical protein n=1 Tax=Streptomyces sp. NPDC001621 TaxID=3364594 RepID=UPI0036A21FB3
MPYVSLELNYELYFRSRCGVSQGTEMTCKNLRDYYSGWKQVEGIPEAETCPICGNVGFDIILEYVLARGGCIKNSFLPEQGVRMADGAIKEIKDVKVGDEVLATDPQPEKLKRVRSQAPSSAKALNTLSK